MTTENTQGKLPGAPCAPLRRAAQDWLNSQLADARATLSHGGKVTAAQAELLSAAPAPWEQLDEGQRRKLKTVVRALRLRQQAADAERKLRDIKSRESDEARRARNRRAFDLAGLMGCAGLVNTATWSPAEGWTKEQLVLALWFLRRISRERLEQWAREKGADDAQSHGIMLLTEYDEAQKAKRRAG